MLNGRRQPSGDGTSRMNREVQVRFCEGLGVKFPGPTRLGCVKTVLLVVRAEDKCEQDAAAHERFAKAASAILLLRADERFWRFARSQGHELKKLMASISSQLCPCKRTGQRRLRIGSFVPILLQKSEIARR